MNNNNNLAKDLLKFNIYQQELGWQNKTGIQQNDYVKFQQLQDLMKRKDR